MRSSQFRCVQVKLGAFASSQVRRRRRHARLLARLSGPARLKRVEAAVDRRCPGANLLFPRKVCVTMRGHTLRGVVVANSKLFCVSAASLDICAAIY